MADLNNKDQQQNSTKTMSSEISTAVTNNQAIKPTSTKQKIIKRKVVKKIRRRILKKKLPDGTVVQEVIEETIEPDKVQVIESQADNDKIEVENNVPTEKKKNFNINKYKNIYNKFKYKNIEEKFKIKFLREDQSFSTFRYAVRSFSPVASYLNSLSEENPDYIEEYIRKTLFITNPLQIKMIRKKLIATCALGIAGEKVSTKDDTALILKGPQGIGKSTFLKILATARGYSSWSVLISVITWMPESAPMARAPLMLSMDL